MLNEAQTIEVDASSVGGARPQLAALVGEGWSSNTTGTEKQGRTPRESGGDSSVGFRGCSAKWGGVRRRRHHRRHANAAAANRVPGGTRCWWL